MLSLVDSMLVEVVKYRVVKEVFVLDIVETRVLMLVCERVIIGVLVLSIVEIRIAEVVCWRVVGNGVFVLNMIDAKVVEELLVSVEAG